MHVEKNESFCIVDTFQQVTIEGAALTLNIGIFCIKRPIIWPSVRLANTSSASLIIGVRDVCVCVGGRGQFEISFGQSARTAPKFDRIH